jgi:hypothetical protein
MNSPTTGSLKLIKLIFNHCAYTVDMLHFKQAGLVETTEAIKIKINL